MVDVVCPNILIYYTPVQRLSHHFKTSSLITYDEYSYCSWQCITIISNLKVSPKHHILMLIFILNVSLYKRKTLHPYHIITVYLCCAMFVYDWLLFRAFKAFDRINHKFNLSSDTLMIYHYFSSYIIKINSNARLACSSLWVIWFTGKIRLWFIVLWIWKKINFCQ